MNPEDHSLPVEQKRHSTASPAAERFLEHLGRLKEKDTGAMARLRHSLAHEPGAYPPAYAYVERFVGDEDREFSAHRRALYLVAGLFARHPSQSSTPFPRVLGELQRAMGDNGDGVERRFIALLNTDADSVSEHLRHAVSLLKSKEKGFDYASLLDDLSRWMNPNSDPDRLRQKWAREFYRAVSVQEAASEE